MTAWRVVIADDDATLRRLLRAFLDRDGRFEVVHESPDGADAIEAIERTDPDVLLLDLAMPNVDGLEVLSRLQGRTRPGVVVLTGFTEPAVCEQVLELGARACLQKGDDFRRLIDELAAAAGA